MKNFTMRLYQNTMFLSSFLLPWREPEIIKGSNIENNISSKLKALNANTVLFITDKNLYNNDMTADFLDKLERLGINFAIFSDTMPNPPIFQVEECVKIYNDKQCEAIIALGGGSPIDLAKATAARIARPNRTIPELKGLFKIKRPLIPLLVIPTTSGSGSEVTIASVITDPEAGEKYAINDLVLIPKYVVLNPLYASGMPKNITAETGMDALTHAIEAYIGRSNTKYTRKKSENAIKLIFENLEKAYTYPDDLNARANMQKAAYDAGCAFTRAYVGYVHALSHAISAKYDTAHGLANAVLLPYVLESYGDSVVKSLALLARQNGIADSNDDDKSASNSFIKHIQSMNRRMNIPEYLADIKDEDIPAIVKLALKEANPLYPVPSIFDENDLTKILKNVQCENTSIRGFTNEKQQD